MAVNTKLGGVKSMMESATGQNLHALQGDRILQNIQMYKPFVDEEGRK